MKNYIKIILIVFTVLLFLTAVYYFIFPLKPNDIGNINIHNGIEDSKEIDDVVDNVDDGSISKLETLENSAVGYAFDYPSDKYEAKVILGDNRQNASTGLYVKGIEINPSAIVFYSHTPDRILGRGGFFGDLGGYVEKDDEYFMSSEGAPFEILDVLETELGKVVVIDGSQFDYSAPTMGPGEFGALVNLENNKFTGIAIQPGGQGIEYEEFVSILKTLRPIVIDEELLEIDISDWTLFEDVDLGVSNLMPDDNCHTYIDTYLKDLDPVFTISCRGRNGMQLIYEPLNYYQEIVYDLNNMTLEEVANTFYNLNSTVRERSELEKIEINGYEAYKFSVSSPVVYPCKDDVNTACGSRPVYYQDLIFISDGDKILMIRKGQNHPVTDRVLESFSFITQG